MAEKGTRHLDVGSSVGAARDGTAGALERNSDSVVDHVGPKGLYSAIAAGTEWEDPRPEGVRGY